MHAAASRRWFARARGTIRHVPVSRAPLLAVLNLAAIVSTSGACIGSPIFIGSEDLTPSGSDASAQTFPIDAGEVDETTIDSSVDDSAALDEGVVFDSTPLLDSGLDVAPPPGRNCTGDLTNVGTGDFHVSFLITTTQQGFVAVVNQRWRCGYSPFWDIRMLNGAIEAETDIVQTPTSYTEIISTGAPINDGKPHTVFLVRASGMLTIYVDSVPRGTKASAAMFGPLAGVRAGIDICVGWDLTVNFDTEQGELADLCVAAP
jgi:hypothetical protein